MQLGDARWPDETRVPTGLVSSSDGVTVAYYDGGGSPEAPVLLLAHATGFCGPVLMPMGRRVSRAHPVALDERGHGASSRPASGDYTWDGFGADVLAVVDAMGAGPVVGFGHSCGGAALLLAEQQRPGTFAGLFCFEPIVYPGDDPPGPLPAEKGNPLAASALRRREHFASRLRALENFASKAPFDTFYPEALAAYVDNGFEPDPAHGPGAIRLRCRRQDEAMVFAMSFAHGAFGRLHEVACPVALAYGTRSTTMGRAHLELLASRLNRAEIVAFEGLGHLAPMEDPARVAAAVESRVAAWTRSGPAGAPSPGADTPLS
ncbi:MAG: alpha/beta fold hydrolase [Acidimicrobiales bacterium]